MTSARDFVWQTSNMEYGRFYRLTTEEEQKMLVGEREGRCEVLTKAMITCRKQLGLMRLRDESPDPDLTDDFDAPTESYFHDHLERLKKNYSKPASSRTSKATHSDPLPDTTASKSSRSTSSTTNSLPVVEKTQASNPVEISRSTEEATEQQRPRGNGRIDPTGIEEDTKQLESLLNRLADKLQSFTNGGVPVPKSPSRHTPVQDVKYWQYQKSLHGPKQKEQSTQCKKSRSASGSRLPPYCRYGFYRYYGYAGQGAKTSGCHNLPLGQKPPYGKRTKVLFNC